MAWLQVVKVGGVGEPLAALGWEGRGLLCAGGAGLASDIDIGRHGKRFTPGLEFPRHNDGGALANQIPVFRGNHQPGKRAYPP